MNRTVNPFVYQRILESEMPNPTIPAYIGETYGQCYEDVIVDGLLRAFRRRFDRPFNGLAFVEVGANHPVCTSASYLLARKYGASGVLVEANPKLVPALQKFRPKDRVIHAAVTDSDAQSAQFFISPENEISSLSEHFVKSWKNLGVEETITVPTVRINDLLAMVAQAEVVLLSIDVEGYDYQLLADVDYGVHRPFVIQIEPSDWIAPGTSTRMIDFLAAKGYALVAETDVNLIFQDRQR